jgi:hypothetical protein
MFSWLDRFCKEWAGGGAKLFCCCGGGGVVVAVGTCELVGGGFHCSDVRRGLLAKLGFALVPGSLLPYAESKLVSTVSRLGLCSLVSNGSFLTGSLSFSFEWNGFESLNLDFFLSSADGTLVAGAIGCDVFAGWPFNPPDIVSPCRSRLLLRFRSLAGCRCSGSIILGTWTVGKGKVV